jgi:ribosomal protein S18 acetylase RimI-like enzyme
MNISLATIDNLDKIMEIQKLVYTGCLLESYNVFKSIIEEKTSYVAIINDEIVGYILTHPSVKDEVYLLNHELKVKNNRNALFIHDICINPLYRNKGIGKFLVNYIKNEYKCIQCIALENALIFWKKQGFTRIKILPQDICDNYGGYCEFLEIKQTRL